MANETNLTTPKADNISQILPVNKLAKLLDLSNVIKIKTSDTVLQYVSPQFLE